MAQQRAATQQRSGAGLCRPAGGGDAGDGHPAAQSNSSANALRGAGEQQFLSSLHRTEILRPRSTLCCPCLALRGGGEPAEPSVSGEGAAHRDGGMSDGGQGGMEEGPSRAGGEPPARSGDERHAGRVQGPQRRPALLGRRRGEEPLARRGGANR